MSALYNPLLRQPLLGSPRLPLSNPQSPLLRQPLLPSQSPLRQPQLFQPSPLSSVALAPASQVVVQKCKSSTFNYVTGLAFLTLLLGIIAGVLIQYWTSKSDCLSKGQFGSAIFYSFIAALIIGIITFVSHRIYCNSK
jgi:hypothetical protein